LIVLYVSILALLQLGLDGSMLSEETKFEWGLQGDVPKECREATLVERQKDHLMAQGKASTFNLRGFYRCERQVFDYGERHSFDSFTADHASQRALEVALKVADFTSKSAASSESGSLWPVKVEVLADSEAASSYLRSVFEVSLLQYAPRVKVLKQASLSPYTKLRVVLRRLDDPKALFGVSMSRDVGLRQDWVEL
jgi:hypothetical protein